MAARLRVAVVSVTHKSKGKGNSAINAAIGSIGFTASSGSFSTMKAARTTPDKPARTEAEDFLRDILRDGPRLAKEIEGEAKEAGISWRTVNRAKKALGVIAERKATTGDGFGGSGRWYWLLPTAPKDAKNAYVVNGGAHEPPRHDPGRLLAATNVGRTRSRVLRRAFSRRFH